jgi:hypothetical protein
MVNWSDVQAIWKKRIDGPGRALMETYASEHGETRLGLIAEAAMEYIAARQG